MINRHVLFALLFFIIYVIAFCSGVLVYQLPAKDIFVTVLVFGAGLSTIAWLLVRKGPLFMEKPPVNKEAVLLLLLVGWVAVYISWGPTFINGLLPVNMRQNGQWQFFIAIIRKLVVFVVVPGLLYRLAGFSWPQLGIIPMKTSFSRRHIGIFGVMAVAILLAEYFCSNGAKPLREGQFHAVQLAVGVPLTFVWLFVEAGLTEEFFFRAILQARLSVLLKSKWGGILIVALIFGVVHAPGLYLGGAAGEGIEEKLPFAFWICYCIINMSVAGIFLGIIYSKTRNIYLVMALHAITDLLPNLSIFIYTWKL